MPLNAVHLTSASSGAAYRDHTGLDCCAPIEVAPLQLEKKNTQKNKNRTFSSNKNSFHIITRRCNNVTNFRLYQSNGHGALSKFHPITAYKGHFLTFFDNFNDLFEKNNACSARALLNFGIFSRKKNNFGVILHSKMSKNRILIFFKRFQRGKVRDTQNQGDFLKPNMTQN